MYDKMGEKFIFIVLLKYSLKNVLHAVDYTKHASVFAIYIQKAISASYT